MHGLMDKRGRLREGWLRRLESLVNTAKNVDALLGYERRQRDVTLADYLAGLQDAHDGAPPPTGDENDGDREETAGGPADAPSEAAGAQNRRGGS
jgi:hypothetical protein